MKSRLKIIIVTFVATTAFWCLVIVGLFWWASLVETAGVSPIQDAANYGYFNVMRAWNDGKRSVKFTVAEFRTNAPGTNASEVVLLERQLPPSGDLWVGIKKEEPQSK
jgi:hypothetical protein